MTKLIYLFNVCIFLFLWLSPQISFSQYAVSSSGGQIKGNGGSTNFTVGQVVFNYKQGNNGRMNEGVQQVFNKKTTPIAELNYLREVVLFPNPTVDFLTINIPFADHANIYYQVLDSFGKEIRTGVIQSIKTDISLGDIPSGNYHIFIRTKGENRQFKIIKI